MRQLRAWYLKYFNFISWRSPIRWAALSLLFSLALFFLALSPSFYSIYIAFVERVVVPPWNWLTTGAFILFIATGIMGVIVGIVAFAICIYWLFHTTKDESYIILNQIKNHLGIETNDNDNIGEINKQMREKLKWIRDKRDKQNVEKEK
jgi:type VI protein secretion system component VasK